MKKQYIIYRTHDDYNFYDYTCYLVSFFKTKWTSKEAEATNYKYLFVAELIRLYYKHIKHIHTVIIIYY